MASVAKSSSKKKMKQKKHGEKKYALSEVKALGHQLLSSRAHINNLPLLLSFVNPSSPPPFVLESLLSLQSFFTPLLPQLPPSSSKNNNNNDAQNDAEFIYLTWLRSKFDELAQSLIEIAVSSDSEPTLRVNVLKIFPFLDTVQFRFIVFFLNDWWAALVNVLLFLFVNLIRMWCWIR